MAKDSMLTGLRVPHIRLIAQYWVRFSLRTGGGLVALLLVLLTGLSVAAAFIAPVEALMQASPELGHQKREAAVLMKEMAESDDFVNLADRVIGDEVQTRYLLQSNPALVSVIVIVLLWFFPFLACLGSFNQTAGDIGNRGLRYLLLRTERPNLFLGRFFGTLGFAAVSSVTLFALLILYIGFKFGVYPWGDLLLWGAQGMLAVIFLSLPYLALCAWVSSMMDSAFGSLMICLLLAGFPIILLKIADSLTRVDLEWTMRLMPWGWKYDLLSADIGTRVLAYAVMGGFTLVFLTLGLRTFQKRDL